MNLAISQGHEVLLVQAGQGSESDRPGLEIVQLEVFKGARRRLRQLLPPDPLRAPRMSRRAVVQAREAITAFAPDVAIVSEVMSWGIARALLPDRPWIYDAHNAEQMLFRSHRRHATTWFDRVTYAIDHRRVRKAERGLLSGANSVLAVSDVDAAALRRARKGIAVTVVPNSIAPPETPADPAATMPVVLFVGTLHYPPNSAAVRELVAEVMPRVRGLVPEARLIVVGRGPTETTRALVNAAPGCELKEDLPDLGEVYREARCVAIPMRLGSGTNIKLFEALSYGVPVVATTKAVEGIPVHADAEVIVQDGPDRFAVAVAALLTDADRARDLGQRGRRAFLERLAWEAMPAEQLARALCDVATSRGTP